MNPKFSTCKLCLLDNVQLQNSHIIPKWAYKEVRGGSKDIINYAKGIVGYSDKQLKELLLCSACEQKIGLRERYIKSISFEKREECNAIHLLNFNVGQSNNNEQIAWTDASLLDKQSIAYFAVSVIWRASVSSEGKRKVSLGPYQEVLRRYLNGEIDFPKEANLRISFHDPYKSEAFHQLATLPATNKLSNKSHYVYCHRFLCVGVLYELFLGKNIPSEFQELCFIHSSDSKVFWTSLDQDSTMEGIKEIIRNAEVRGRLAKEK